MVCGCVCVWCCVCVCGVVCVCVCVWCVWCVCVYGVWVWVCVWCRDELREHLKDVQKQIMAQKQEVSSSDPDSSSGESIVYCTHTFM